VNLLLDDLPPLSFSFSVTSIDLDARRKLAETVPEDGRAEDVLAALKLGEIEDGFAFGDDGCDL
jgi:hypothetical protein